MSLEPLFAPRSVAIVGASEDEMKWGNWLARSALRGEAHRAVYLVNRRGGRLLRRTVHASLADLPEAPELVVIAVPPARLDAAADDALRAGARALVVITAGLGETGEAGRQWERALVGRVRAAGARLVGPNCLGLVATDTGLDLATADVPEGSLALVSQSGNLALELFELAADAGLGFSRFVSIGNQADVTAAELVAHLAAHAPTRLIALYLEDFRDGRALARAVAAAGKPVVVLAAGRSTAAAMAARSHTGALVSDLHAVAAACRAAGAVLVRTPAELVEAAALLLTPHPPAGRRVGVVADGGGHGVVAADALADRGLELPGLSPGLAARVAELLPGSIAANPVDFAGAGERDLRRYAQVIEALLHSGEVDSVLLTGYFGGYSRSARGQEALELGVARRLAEAARASGRALAVHSMHHGSGPARALREDGVPVYRTVEAACRALGSVAAAGDGRRAIPELPAPAPPVEDSGFWAARALLAAAGVPMVTAVRIAGLDEALSAARRIGFPVVLKATGVLHKSDAGGVALGLAGEAELVAAFERMAPLATDAYALERMADAAGGVELIAGSRRDPRFGPVTAVGLGGVYAEVLDDVAIALGPVDAAEAERLLRSLRGAALLTGARGRPPLALGAAAAAVAALSRAAAEHPELREVEVNPLLVTGEAALGLDARIVAG
jgi:acetate---CoA ligase (ADP-forming)